MKSGSIAIAFLISSILLADIQAVNAAWVEDGNPICTGAGRQANPCIVPDGAGGAIIVWEDGRSGEGDIYAQRVDPYGRLMWRTAGAVVCAEPDWQRHLHMVPDGAGGAFIAWVDNRLSYSEIYIQRINGSGETLWDEGGVAVCPVPAFKYWPKLIRDGAGGVFVVWEDMRDGGRWVIAQRIDRYGERQWDAGGIKVSDARMREGFLRVHSDASDGAIIVWAFSTSVGWLLYAQRIDADGNFPWNSVTILAEGDLLIDGFSSASSGGGSVTVVWDETAGSAPPHRLSAQRIGADGTVQWNPGGILIFASSDDCDSPRIVPDSDGGGIIVWEVPGDGSGTFWQYAQRIDGGGDVCWEEGGVQVGYTATSQHGLVVAPDGAGGAISVWSEERDPAQYDIVAQRIDQSGDFQWTITGLRVCSADGDQGSPACIPDGAGGAIMTWHDGRAGYYYDIYALRVDDDGELPPVTRLLSYAAYGDGRDIVVEWALAQAGTNVRFSIWRGEGPDGMVQEIDDPFITNVGLAFTFRDRELEPSTSCRYRLDVEDDEGTRTLFETEPVTTPPMPVTLYQNYPNPFNPATTIRFDLPEAGNVKLAIFDVSGRPVRALIDGFVDQTRRTIQWDACDKEGRPVASGVYYYRLTAGKVSRTKKMILSR